MVSGFVLGGIQQAREQRLDRELQTELGRGALDLDRQRLTASREDAAAEDRRRRLQFAIETADQLNAAVAGGADPARLQPIVDNFQQQFAQQGPDVVQAFQNRLGAVPTPAEAAQAGARAVTAETVAREQAQADVAARPQNIEGAAARAGAVAGAEAEARSRFGSDPVRTQRINDTARFLIGRDMSPTDALLRAQKLADGLLVIEPDPLTGDLVEVDRTTGTATPIDQATGQGVLATLGGTQAGTAAAEPGAQPGAAETPAAPRIRVPMDMRTELLEQNAVIERILALAEGIDVSQGTGPMSNLAAAAGRVVGPFVPGELFPDQQAARDQLRKFNQEAKQALVNNPRFPVAEQNIVREILPDPDKFFEDPDTAVKDFARLLEFLATKRTTNEQLVAGQRPSAEQLPQFDTPDDEGFKALEPGSMFIDGQGRLRRKL